MAKGSSSNSTEYVGVDTEPTALQKHVMFFDQNKDGILYPWETYQGGRAIGCSILRSTGLAIFVHLFLSGKTRPGKFPSLLFPIEIKNIQRAKHGSDSGTYDTEGRFVPSKFEEIFSKHACTNSDYLTAQELKEMRQANRVPKDFFGRIQSYFEWNILYDLSKDKNGLLQKDTVRGFYDGSLFEKLAKEKASSGKHDVTPAYKRTTS